VISINYEYPPYAVVSVLLLQWGSLDNSVNIVTRLRVGRPGFDVQYGSFFFANAFRPALGPTPHSTEWVTG